jgi:hypothetical protein
MLAALVAALVVPVGYALSVESTQVSTQARHAAIVPAASAAVVPAAAAAAVAAPIAIHPGADHHSPLFYPVSDAAKLLGIGTVLFGLAAAVRKAI